MLLETIIGFLGAALLLAAHAAKELRVKRVPAMLLFSLNIAGSVGIAAASLAREAWPAAVLNIIWAGLSCWALATATWRPRPPVRSSRDGLPDIGLEPWIRQAFTLLADVTGLDAANRRINIETPGLVASIRAMELEQLTVLGEELGIIGHGRRHLVFVNHVAADAPGPRLHSHRGHQLELVLDGVVVFEVDGQRRLVNAGEWLAIPAGAPHRFVPVEGPATVVTAVVGPHALGFFREWNATTRLDVIRTEDLDRALRRLGNSQLEDVSEQPAPASPSERGAQ